MTTIYTKITKPSGTLYTNLNSVGKEQYDQSSITYDSSSTFYDGINATQYTKLTKPAGTSYTKITKPT